VEIYEMGMKKPIQRINETKNRLFEKINKIEKPLAKLTKRKRKIQMNKIRDEKWDTTEVQRIISEYFENLHYIPQ
jgi:hypothetical protein